MTIKDIRIGSRVKYHDNVYKVVGITCHISNEDSGSVDLWDASTKTYFGEVPFKDVDPILLTDTLLKSLGYKEDEHCLFSRNCVLKRGIREGYIVWMTEPKVYYLHELDALQG